MPRRSDRALWSSSGSVSAVLVAAIAAAVLLASVVPCLAQPVPTRLTYTVYAHGFRVAELQASIATSPSEYAMQVSYRLTGVVGLFASGSATTSVNGRFADDAPLPGQMLSISHSRGQTRVTQLNWRDGNPVTTQLIPPIGGERELVPAADQANTIDTMSAMAGLLRQVAATGRCDAARRTFDGRRLSSFSARTVADEVLDRTARSAFAGPALRCDFQGRQIGGFSHDSDPATRGKPQPGTAWFASLRPGDPPVPVRITFESPSIGKATMYVTGAER